MSKIRVTSRCEIYDGMTITLKAPCDSTEVDGLNVYDTTGNKQTYSFRDVHGTNVSAVADLFEANSYITVTLDTGNGYAYLQNADTNSYLEGVIEDLQESISGKASTSHSHALTESSITGTLPVSKGGTGATTAAVARTNLGITPENIGALSASGTAAASKMLGAAEWVSGSILDFAESCNVGVTPFITQASTTDLPNSYYEYSMGFVYKRSANFIVIEVNPYNGSRGTARCAYNSGWGSWYFDLAAILPSNVYGSSLPAAGNTGRLFFKKVSS